MERTARQSVRPAPRLRLEAIEDRNLPSPPYGPWGEPVNLGPVVNTAFGDQHPAISKDGLSLYITSNRPENPDDLVRDDNIWVSHRPSPADPWGAPVELGPAVNTGANDRVPTFSRDGHWMFFGSNRAGGRGGLDLWASYRQDVHDDFAWQAPVNLGPDVNTGTDEDGATLYQDDETGTVSLYFTSFNRAGFLGTDWNIYVSSQQPDGSFGPAAPVTPLNVSGGATNARDTRTAIRHDGRELFVTSNRPGGEGLIDLWVSTRDTTADAWSVPVNLGPVVNGGANDGAPALSADGTELYFYSNRTGSIPDASGVPTNDLYVVTRTKLNKPVEIGGGASPILTYRKAGGRQDEVFVLDPAVVAAGRRENYDPDLAQASGDSPRRPTEAGNSDHSLGAPGVAETMTRPIAPARTGSDDFIALSDSFNLFAAVDLWGD